MPGSRLEGYRSPFNKKYWSDNIFPPLPPKIDELSKKAPKCTYLHAPDPHTGEPGAPFPGLSPSALWPLHLSPSPTKILDRLLQKHQDVHICMPRISTLKRAHPAQVHPIVRASLVALGPPSFVPPPETGQQRGSVVITCR